MPDLLYLDFETRSELELKTVGLSRYANHPSTQVLMLAWAVNDGPVELWQPHLGPMPDALAQRLHRDRLVAWNASFERAIFKTIRLDLALPHWSDVMVWARHLSLPGELAEVCSILRLPDTVMKLESGQELIRRFCKPAAAAGADIFGARAASFRDWSTDAADWERFCDYCRHDVEAERAIFKKLASVPLPESEQRLWELDQEINERGLPINRELVGKALALAQREHDELVAEQRTITGLANPNSPAQLLPWLRTRGYGFGSLRKEFAAAAQSSPDLTEEARTALNLRQKLAKTSYRKFIAIREHLDSDDRLRYQFAFMGASRTGRWSGHGVQVHNLPRPDKKVAENLDRVLEIVRKTDYEAAKREFGSAIDMVVGAIRSVIQAPAGKKLIVCDLSAIENRALGWLSGCDAILDVFRRGLDPYLDFGARMYRKPYEAVTKAERQIAKPPVLGCGYGLGAGKEGINGAGDIIHTGLWGYAERMGIEMTPEQREEAVCIFRQSYPEVVTFWHDIEDAAKAAIQTGAKTRIRFIEVSRLVRADKSIILKILLPSGRGLYYLNARVAQDGERNGIVYDGIGHGVAAGETPGVWGPTHTYGAKTVENITQAVARDVLASCLGEAAAAGFTIVGHVHDEIICEEDEDGLMGLDELQAVMSAAPPWAPGLPLGAAGYEDRVYRKD